MGKNTKSIIKSNGKDKANKKKAAKKNKPKKIRSKNGDDCTSNYFRVETTYYKRIVVKNRFGVDEVKLVKWTRHEFLADFEKHALDHIRRFDGFYVWPDNENHVESKGKLYNLYCPFPHNPSKGDWKTIKSFLKHIFKEHYKLGLQYLKALFLHPDKVLPILVLVSSERGTGKTTFLNWIMMVFGSNTVMLNSKSLSSDFNGIYAGKNILCVDEAGLEKNNSSETLKFLSTTKTLPVNEKFIAPYILDFFGKIIVASNKEKNFTNIDSNEIRYWVRKLNTPKNHNSFLLKKLRKQIPAFLYYLKHDMPELDWSNSRQLFTAEQISNSNLNKVVEESYSYVYKELKESLSEFFSNTHESGLESIQATITDIKERLFPVDNKISRTDIKKALEEEFKFKYDGTLCKYKPFDHGQAKTGRPWTIEKKYFI
jgi:hypothetical protein